MSYKKFLILFQFIFVFSAMPAGAGHVDIVSLVKENKDRVVSVRGSTTRVSSSQAVPNAPLDPFFPFAPDFFERFRPQQNRPQSSIGSGFIIDAEGYVLTNAHVIEGMDEIVVSLSDGEEYTAKVVGSDDKTDIALLKIEVETPLTSVLIGNSDELLVGQPVLAIGSPYGLDQTVTSGIVSALGRRLPSEDYVPFIQTDAAVNPGNSGGPLINEKGEVIGINSQIISPVGAFAGVSFAIPINVAMDIQSRLREHGVVRRGRLGIYFSPVNKKLAEAFGLPETQGVLVQKVVEDSSASEAGLENGDVLLSFNGHKIEDSVELPQLIGSTEPGTTVKIEVWRDGEIIELSSELGEVVSDISPSHLLGLVAEDLSEELQRRTGLSAGVVIKDIKITESSPRGINQIQPNDIITDLLIKKRRRQVSNRETLASLIKQTEKGEIIAVYIWRSGRTIILPIEL